MSAFNQLAAKLAGRPGVTNPRGLAAAIGRQKYGSQVMGQAAQKGVPAQSIVKRKRY